MIATSYRYIVQRAGVRSGYAIVEGTRIGVHDVVAIEFSSQNRSAS
jgi:uncharacterized protein (DUF433 family)